MPKLVAHSRLEARWYVGLVPCERCGGGPLEPVWLEGEEAEGAEGRLAVPAICAGCGAETGFAFQLAGVEAGQANPSSVNPSAEPSQIIDVAQWLTLYAAREDAWRAETSAVHVRRLKLEAAACLTEALKFYEEGEDLPPPAAFFSAASRDLYASEPERFRRGRLLGLLGGLPRASNRGNGQ